MIYLHLTIITGTGIGLTGQDPIPTVIDTEVIVRVIHREVTPGHITDVHTEAHCTTDTQTHIAIIDKILDIEDFHHTEVSLHIPEIAVHLDHVPQTKILTLHLLNLPTAPTRQPGKTRLRNINKSSLMTPPSEYYSSDEPSSESDEDLN